MCLTNSDTKLGTNKKIYHIITHFHQTRKRKINITILVRLRGGQTSIYLAFHGYYTRSVVGNWRPTVLKQNIPSRRSIFSGVVKNNNLYNG